jgi:hypothetical protein
MQNKITFIFAVTIFVLFELTFAQGKKYEGPDDPAGDVAAEREGFMTGNRVYLYFQNTTELSRWPLMGSKWPNTYEGTDMLDGVGLLIGARVYIEKTEAERDTIPVTDPGEIVLLGLQGKLDTLYFLQTSYREEMDTDPTGTVEWGLYPVFGYFNPLSEYPAMSNLPSTWPIAGWPATGDQLQWPGEWDGRFGRGVIKADLETYFVVNDAHDQEYLGPEDKVRYYPRPGVKIGDKKPDVTIQFGKPWGGIGIRVETRGFQWNNPQARDCIFWEYCIANISDYDLRDVCFGYWVDNGIGDIGSGGDDDDVGYFDKMLDMAYSWDIDGIGQGGIHTGITGFAYLESPGFAYDGIDNDGDGLIDERRDNPAGNLVGPTDGIANLSDFLSFYHLEVEDLHEHYEGDEDQDWQDGEDINGNGVYDIGEFAGDDVGLDGVGPGELNYTGPDEGECNHMPDYLEGVGCEPNFAVTDVSESDMIGLTSFMLFPVAPHRPPYDRWFRNDKSLWEIINSDTLMEYFGTVSNLIEVFASGPFPLLQGRTERISMSELHSYDPLEGLNSPDHTAPALFELKRIVQVIYEKDYRFAQPPSMPTLTATPGDGMVILSWDDVADTRTRDPFAGNVNDFEGYKLFRATDKKFQDVEVITDGFGTPMFKKPIYQCDLKDGIHGFTDFGLVNGMGYYLGDDTGIKHYFIDANVQNGRTYYYAIVAYDYGLPDVGPGIAPSENNIIIELDEAEEVRSYSKNVRIVTPYQKAAGYIPPEIELEENDNIIGFGSVIPEILAENELKASHKYAITFSIDTVWNIENYKYGLLYTNNGIEVYDVTDSIVLYEESPRRFTADNLVYDDTSDYWYINDRKTIATDIFDGLRLNISVPNKTAQFDYENSGWITGSSPINITPTARESNYFPWDYDIVFSSENIYTGRGSATRVRDENDKLIRQDLLTKESFNFYVINKTFTDSVELMDLVVQDINKNGQFDILDDRIFVGPVNSEDKWAGTAFIIDFFAAFGDEIRLPQPDDVYRVTFKRPFWITDSVYFSVTVYDSIDTEDLKYTMEKIKVVPNPYVATNAMEPEVANWSLNQRRRLLFTHLPAQCTIRIFTVSGTLVDKIEVNNPSDNGIAHWDMLTKEELEIAAGIYIYHVEAKETGDVKMGKFAVIK